MTYFYIAIWIACLAYDVYYAYRAFTYNSFGMGVLMTGLSLLAIYMIVMNVRQLIKEKQS